MNLYIPLANSQSIPHEVLYSIANHGVLLNIIPCCTDGVLEEEVSIKKRTCEGNSRNKLLEYVKSYEKEEFCAMQNRYVVLIQQYAYLEAIKFLREHKEYAAIALPWKDYEVKDHILNWAVCFRTEILKQLTEFRFGETGHFCQTMKEDLKSLGYKYEFLPSDKRMIKKI